MEKLTSIEAANLFGMDRSTTRKAAASGQVPGAHREPRVGVINPPWVATLAAWEEWHRHRRPVGRPCAELDQPLALAPTSLLEAWAEFSDGCGSDAPVRTMDELRNMVYLLGLEYRIEGAADQPETATGGPWGNALQAMYDTAWAWDAGVPDDAVVDRFRELVG